MLFDTIDWLAIALFFLVMFGIAAYFSRRSAKNTTDFFLSGKSMPWWLIGISMCAASTSTNSANMFTEYIRNSNLGENWKWWAFLLTGMLTVFVYSKLWVRSGAKSDIEFYELRYTGKAAAFLRGFRALYLGFIFNVISIGLVMLAAIKIGQVMFGLDQWTVIIITCIASVIYSALGGLKGAIYTDLILFVIIMVGAVVGMHYAVTLPEVGGYKALLSNPAVREHMGFFPDIANPDLFVAAFVIPIAVQWWNVWYPGSEPGGGGYIVQRMLSAKDENHCMGGTIFYQVINYAIRPWPWYITAFASLLVFPDLLSLQEAFPHINPSLVKGDLAYPAMLTFVPNGWLGLVAAGLMGALFSTVAAHLSMGSNYIANDFWKRFVRPEAGDKEVILVGRLSTVVIMVCTALLSPYLVSAGTVFNLILQVGAGTGLIYLLRWFWMRINAWSEITAMFVSFIVAVFLQLIYPHLGLPELTSWQNLLIVMGITTVAWVGVTLLTKPTGKATQEAFQEKIHTTRHDIAWGLLAMTLACASVYSAMFAVGYWIYGETTLAIIMTAVFIVSTAALLPVIQRLNGKTARMKRISQNL
ncbi:MAG: Na+:solute symporter [Bacteroidales bacterium]|nr:Na+:solute symporter [Bacteroidales bacterium]